jgi:RND family efflux transporter MFP subunit
MVEGKRSPIQSHRIASKVALAAALLMMSAACGDRNVYVPPPPPKVTVAQPVSRPVTDYLEFTGNTAAINTVKLRARVEGYLEKVLFQDGDRVKKGQLLFLIQQNTYEAKLKQAEAEILANKARLMHAQTEYDRYTRLVKQKAAAQTDVDKWHYERDAAAAAVIASEAQRDLAQLNLSYTKVTSPFNGRVGRRLKDPGNLVGAGQETVLAEVNQIDPIYVYFNINEQDLLRVRGEEDANKDASKEKWPVYFGLADEEGYPHKGYLDFAAITINPTTGTLLLRGIFPNPKAVILPGMFARVRAPVAEAKPALLIPGVAIGYDQQGPYVLLVNEKNVVVRRPVKLGAPQADDYRVILEGLQGDEWVVVNGLLRAIPGRQVAPERQTLPASGGAKAPAASHPAGKTTP